MKHILAVLVFGFFSDSMLIGEGDSHEEVRRRTERMGNRTVTNTPLGNLEEKSLYCQKTLNYAFNFTAKSDKLSSKALLRIARKENASLLDKVKFIVKIPAQMTAQQKKEFESFSPRHIAGEIYTGVTSFCGLLHLSSFALSVDMGIELRPD